jgi:alpha-methylacyl-CoA racemase
LTALVDANSVRDCQSGTRSAGGVVSGPLTGIRVVELAGIGPGPHAAGLLARLGADVVRVARDAEGVDGPARDLLLEGRPTVVADLRSDGDRAAVLALVDHADVLIEGFRPGVTERLGLGPEVCCTRNPRLVYARMTGWGQDGPRSRDAGHDINYISLTGALHAIGRTGERPVPPLNLVGDYGGGSMLLLTGVLAALVERAASGAGQVVDVAMVDGVAQLLAPIHAWLAHGSWVDEREANALDGRLACYDTYTCADGRHVAVGALEEPFWAALLKGLELDAADLPDRFDRGRSAELKSRLADVFARRTRDEWSAHFAGTDACVTPVLSLTEAADDPHLRARATVSRWDGTVVSAPAPRFSRSCPEGPSEARVTSLQAAVTAWTG